MEFLSPGVYIQEKKSSAQAVQGVSTSTFATVGWTSRGPENKATLIGSLPEFFRTFGTYWTNSVVGEAVTAFFANGGARLYFVRVVPTDAVKASVTVPSNLWKFTASSSGAWGNQQKVRLRGNSNYYTSSTGVYSRFDLLVYEESSNGAGDFTQVELFEALDLDDSTGRYGILTVVNDENLGSKVISVEELTGGVPVDFDPTPVVAEALGVGAGGASQLLAVTLAADPVAPFTLQLKVDGVLQATDDGRGVISKVTGSTYTSISGTVDYTTGAVSVTFTPAPALTLAITADYIQSGSSYIDYDLINGADGTSVSRTQVSDPALSVNAKGLYALDVINEMLSIGLPDFPGNVTVHGDLISYCENRKDCFAIVEPALGADEQGALIYKRNTLASQSSYAAMYWPSLKIPDPLRDGRPKIMSCVGHVAGVYARTDNNKNVGKAPGGVDDGALNFCLGLALEVTKAKKDAVYPANINPFQDDPLTGRVVWGVRTLQLSGDYGLVNWRRLAMFLEKSLYNATQDLVFEGIGEGLFTTVQLRFNGFLSSLAAQGYFASKDPAKAFRVTCDSTNNTPSTISQRLLIADVLFAPQTPAEFILLRFERSLNELS